MKAWEQARLRRIQFLWLPLILIGAGLEVLGVTGNITLSIGIIFLLVGTEILLIQLIWFMGLKK